MNLLEKTPLVGELEIYIVKNSERELFFKEKNLITKAAKISVLSSLYTPDLLSDPISLLKVGSGGTIDPEGFFPKQEDPYQTDLVTPLLSINTSFSNNTSEVSVTFIAEVDQNQLNGILLSEAGLFKSSGFIFNVKNHPGIPKTQEFAVHYEWKILIP